MIDMGVEPEPLQPVLEGSLSPQGCRVVLQGRRLHCSGGSGRHQPLIMTLRRCAGTILAVECICRCVALHGNATQLLYHLWSVAPPPGGVLL